MTDLRNIRTTILNTGTPDAKREEILDYFHKTFTLDETLYDSLGKDYAVEHYSLILLGDEKQLPRTMARVAGMDHAMSQIGTLIGSNRAVCGILREEEMTFLFGERGRQVGSVAAVPLSYGNLYGILAVGNSDPNYYKSSMGTLFLNYIAEVLNRILPGFLKPV